MFVAQNLSKKKDKSNSNVVVKIIKKNEVCNLAMPNMTLEIGIWTVHIYIQEYNNILADNTKKQQE